MNNNTPSTQLANQRILSLLQNKGQILQNILNIRSKYELKEPANALKVK